MTEPPPAATLASDAADPVVDPGDAAAKAAAASAPAPVSGRPDPSIFADCTGRRVDPANEFIGCKGFMASVHRPVGYAVDGALATMVQDVKHSGYGNDARTVTEAPYRFRLDDRVLPGRRYTARNALGVTDHHVAVALEAQSGKVLVAHCHANGQLSQGPEVIDGICRDALATILTGQVPAAIYLAKAPYADGTVVGRALTTPAGCERGDPTEQRIRCGEAGQLSWYQARTSLVPLSVVASAKTAGITSSAEAAQVTVGVADAVKCTVEGVETTCVHHRLDIEGEPPVHFYQAKVEVRGDLLYAICSGAGAAPTAPPPKPCDQVFQW